MPTKTDQIPEEATEEPRIVTPEEDAERAAQRLERQDRDPTFVDRPFPNNPLRQPGELSQAPPTPPHHRD